jgi:hypothetical protein
MLEGVRVRDLQRLGARRARRRAAARLPADAPDRLPPPGRRAAGLHLHRGLAGDGRADGDRARRSTAPVGSVAEVVDGHYTGRAGGPFTYREGKAEAMPPAGRARRASTSPSRGRTRTPSPTCRCCAPSGTPWRSTPTASSPHRARRRAGRSCASSGSGGGCAWRVRRRSPPGWAGGLDRRLAPVGGAGGAACHAPPGMSLHELEPRTARDPRPGAAVRRRAHRAARRRVGPRPHVPARAVRPSSASSG